MKLELSVKSVEILLRNGTDLICLSMADQDAFPTLKYRTVAQIETQRGQAIHWCKKHIPGVTPRIINTETGEVTE
jgi:hypothetical protein